MSGGISKMPDLTASVTILELVQLVEYLKSLKGASPDGEGPDGAVPDGEGTGEEEE